MPVGSGYDRLDSVRRACRHIQPPGHGLQVVQLEKELAAQAETAEEKRQAARLQRRLSDAQAAEVAASVQAKLVSAAEREEALRRREAA